MANLVVTIPAYNEEKNIAQVILDWTSIVSQYGGLVLVINDGSTDNTGHILDELSTSNKNLRVIHQANKGHGPAIHNGYRNAIKLGAEFVVQCDGDGEVRAKEFEKLWVLRTASDLVLGVRTQRKTSTVRLILTKCLAQINRLTFGVSLKDANVPFRLYRTTLLARLISEIPDHSLLPNIQASLIAKRLKARVAEVHLSPESLERGSNTLTLFKLIHICFHAAKELLSLRGRMRKICVSTFYDDRKKDSA